MIIKKIIKKSNEKQEKANVTNLLCFKYFKRDERCCDFISINHSLSYRAITTNDIMLKADFYQNDGIFKIEAYDYSNPNDLNASIINNIALKSHLITHGNTTYIELNELQNRPQNDSIFVHGLGCLMLEMLLTFIADFNKKKQDENKQNEKVTYISGSINPLGTKNENELQHYYSKRSGLTDYCNRIKIVIDSEKCKKNELYYDVKSVTD